MTRLYISVDEKEMRVKLMLVPLMGTETSNELVSNISRVHSVQKHYLKRMDCLSRKGITSVMYEPLHQNIFCHLDFSSCSFNRLFLQVHICRTPSLYFFKQHFK